VPVPEVDVEACAAWLAEPGPGRPVLLDVRTPGEFQLAALPGALLVPLHELEEAGALLETLHGRRVVVYCHHGVRSLHGAAYLQQLGMEAWSLRGGIDAWSLRVDPGVPRY
jgi:rhodanese-related sulfurtransferase